MELRRLRYFIAVAKYLNFRRAAAELETSQPSLSQQILVLEKELGVELFERSRRGVKLTDAGAEILVGARQAVIELDAATRKAHEVQSGYRGSLTIGAIGMVTVRHLPDAIRLFRKKYPEIFLGLKILQDRDLVEALKRGTVDIALSGHIDVPDITNEKLWVIPLRVVLPNGHALAGEDRVELSALSGETLIIHPRRGEGGANVDIMALIRKHRFIPGPLWEVSENADLETLLGLVACGAGVTFLPASFALLDPPSVVFKEISECTHVSRIYASYRADEPSPLLDNFLACARHHADAG